MNTIQILEKIQFEMRKMFGKSKTKMTNEAFRKFVSEQWDLMTEDKYTLYDVGILVGRMMNEAIWAKDSTDLVKWIKEDQKMTNFHHNSQEIIYNYYKRSFVDCEAFQEGLAFFQAETLSEAKPFVEFFQNHIQNPKPTTKPIENDDKNDKFAITLEKWSEFFAEDVTICYQLLKKDGEETYRHSKQHRQGIAYLKTHQLEILESFLEDLVRQYPQIQETFKDFYTEKEKAEFMPNVTKIEEFAPLLSPTQIFIFSEYVDDLPYYSIGFHCSWEQEHGLGVIMHKNRVLKICDASEIFDVGLGKRIESVER